MLCVFLTYQADQGRDSEPAGCLASALSLPPASRLMSEQEHYRSSG